MRTIQVRGAILYDGDEPFLCLYAFCDGEMHILALTPLSEVLVEA